MATDKYSLHWNLARDSIVYLPLPTTSVILLGESSSISPCDFETSLRRYMYHFSRSRMDYNAILM